MLTVWDQEFVDTAEGGNWDVYERDGSLTHISSLLPLKKDFPGPFKKLIKYTYAFQ